MVEVILATAVFGLLVTALVGAYLYGQEATALAGNRARAGMLAEEGLEATRNIRDAAFANLVDSAGSGLSTAGNQWGFSGSNDISDISTRQIDVVTIDAYKRKDITSTVTWQQNPQRTGNVAVTTRLTNWQCADQATLLTVNTSGAAATGSGKKDITGITVTNNDANCQIVIDKITVVWTKLTRRISEINIGGNIVWGIGIGSPSPTQLSGTLLDINNVTLPPSSGVIPINYFRFDGNMEPNVLDITFTMADGTTKTVVGISV